MTVEAERYAGTCATGSEIHAATLARGGTSGRAQNNVAEASAAEGGLQDAGFVGEVRRVGQIIQHATAAGAEVGASRPLWFCHRVLQAPKAERFVWARPRIRAWTSWVPS